MLPSKDRTLFAETVTHRRREHQTERDKAVQEFRFKMDRQGISQSSAFNDGKVKIYCEAFQKYAAGVWSDMQRVLGGGFEVYPGCEDDLINFLKESLATVYEADTKSLFAIKNDVHTPTARHLAQCKPRFEFRCQAITEKITTEVKIFGNQLRATKEKEASLVTIEGQKRQVTGFDERGNLVLADGSSYKFIPVKKPAFKFSTRTLVSVSRLLWENGGWFVDDEPLQDCINAEMQKTETEQNQKYAALDKFLNDEFLQDNWLHGLSALIEASEQTTKPAPPTLAKMLERGENPYLAGLKIQGKQQSNQINRQDVRAVAWFAGVENPILLRKFECSPSNANPEKLVQELTKAIEANAEQKGKVALDKANALASLNLKEALSKWMRFDPPGMKTDTKARVEKAVKMYLTDNQKRSLAKIAKEFGVSRKTVSTWFASFTKHTGLKVVSHQRHESVADHLKAESSQDHETSGDDENTD